MDESQAAKVLAKFESSKAAQLTEIIYAGTQKRMEPDSGWQSGETEESEEKST